MKLIPLFPVMGKVLHIIRPSAKMIIASLTRPETKVEIEVTDVKR